MFLESSGLYHMPSLREGKTEIPEEFGNLRSVGTWAFRARDTKVPVTPRSTGGGTSGWRQAWHV